jgi:hypothetical protein
MALSVSWVENRALIYRILFGFARRKRGENGYFRPFSSILRGFN